MGRGLELCWLLLGRMTAVLAVALLLPALQAAMHQQLVYPFLLPAFGAAILAAMFMAMGREHARQLNLREGTYFMVGVWPVLGLIGSMPWLLTGATDDALRALFESLSALTTTGLYCLPEGVGAPELLLWRSLLSWLGGLVFIVVLVTVLPQVSGCFGLTLSARQSIFFSPVWHKMDESIWQGTSVYFVLTLVVAGLFYLAGLDGFAALVQALTSISAGGSAVDPVFLRVDAPQLELAGELAMFLASLNLLLCWKAWQRRSLRLIWQDTELRTYLGLLLGAGLLVSLHLWQGEYYGLGASLRVGFFHVLSFASTSGFLAADIAHWPDFDRYVLFLLAFVGGCIGSVTGGLKVVRFLVLRRMMTAEFRRTLHPRLIVSVKMDGLPVSMKIVGRILSFFFLYMLVFMAFALVLTLAGLDLMPAMGLAAGCLTSVGTTATLCGVPALTWLPDWALAVAALLMLLGRVEIFSFLLLIRLSKR